MAQQLTWCLITWKTRLAIWILIKPELECSSHKRPECTCNILVRNVTLNWQKWWVSFSTRHIPNFWHLLSRSPTLKTLTLNMLPDTACFRSTFRGINVSKELKIVRKTLFTLLLPFHLQNGREEAWFKFFVCFLTHSISST